MRRSVSYPAIPALKHENCFGARAIAFQTDCVASKTACENQLDKLYTRDPQAKDYGIYLVFWFGDKRPRSMPKPPNSLPKPNTAQELENALHSLIKADDQNRLAIVVIDVTRPED